MSCAFLPPRFANFPYICPKLNSTTVSVFGATDMKSPLAILGFVVLLAWACNTEKEAAKEQGQKNNQTFSLYQGHWIDKQFFEQLRKSRSFVGQQQIPAVLELIFPSEYNDTLMVVSSAGVKKMRFSPLAEDSLRFEYGTLSYNNTANIEVLDWTATKGETRALVRLNDAQNTQAAPVLTYLVNKNTLCADYFLLNEKGLKTQDFIFFRADGHIVGWETYDSYRVCYEKDCLALGKGEWDVLVLSKGEKRDYFAWKMIDYDVENEKETQKSKRKRKYGLILTLHKINMDKSNKNGTFKTEKPDLELGVQRLG